MTDMLAARFCNQNGYMFKSCISMCRRLRGDTSRHKPLPQNTAKRLWYLCYTSLIHTFTSVTSSSPFSQRDHSPHRSHHTSFSYLHNTHFISLSVSLSVSLFASLCVSLCLSVSLSLLRDTITSSLPRSVFAQYFPPPSSPIPILTGFSSSSSSQRERERERERGWGRERKILNC